MTISKDDFISALSAKIDAPIHGDGPFAQLVYNPLNILADQIDAEIDKIIKAISLDEDGGDKYLDGIAALYLITRSVGKKSKGILKVTVLSPIEFIPSTVTARTSSGITFVMTRTSSFKVSEWKRQGQYYYGLFEIESENYGENTNVQPGLISSLAGFPGSYVHVTNENKATGGQDRQSNASLIEEIRLARADYSLTRRSGIIRLLKSKYPEYAWFKVSRTRDSITSREKYIRNGAEYILNLSSDIWCAPDGGYQVGSQSILPPYSDTTLSVRPAIGPFKLWDDADRSVYDSIPDIYWKITTSDRGLDNSMSERKQLMFLRPVNKFVSVYGATVDFPILGVSRGDKFYSPGRTYNVIGASGNNMFFDEEFYLNQEITGVLYTVLYTGGTPVLSSGGSGSQTYLMVYGQDREDFREIIDGIAYPDPYTALFKVSFTLNDGTKIFRNIMSVSENGEYLVVEPGSPISPSSFEIVRMRKARKVASVSITEWIGEDYSYFKAEYNRNSGDLNALSDSIYLQVVSKVASGEAYIELNGGYYKIVDITIDETSFYIQIAKSMPPTPVPVGLTNQAIYELSTTGRMNTSESVSDVADISTSGALSLEFNTYDLTSIQAEISGDDDRIVNVGYLARLPYSVTVKVKARYKGSISETSLQSAIYQYIDGLSSESDPTYGEIKYLQASDVIDCCYKTGVDFIDLQYFSVIVSASIPVKNGNVIEVKNVQQELHGEDPRRDVVFVYSASMDDIIVEKI